MLLSAFAPYLIVLFGICLGIARVRPALLAWATCMLGALGGLGLAIWLLPTGQPQSPIFAAIAALPFAVVTVMTIRDLSYPRINDVTTDVINAPGFFAALDAPSNAVRDMAFPDRFGPIVNEAYPDLRPLCLDASPQRVFRAALDQMNATSGWAVTERGVGKVAVATVFGVLTTIAAFYPMLLIDNPLGKVLAGFSGIVILALIFSLIESKFILPAHLAHIQIDQERRSLLARAWGR